jgi:hypothetical protein
MWVCMSQTTQLLTRRLVLAFRRTNLVPDVNEELSTHSNLDIHPRLAAAYVAPHPV